MVRLGLVFGLGIVMFFAAALLPRSGQTATPMKIKLALNWKPEPQFGGFYAAHASGLDKKNGVEFEIIPGGAGTPVVQMVAAGKIDFGIASADEVIVSRARGSDVVAVFASYQTNPQGIMAHEERGFATIQDLFKAEGTIAMQKGLPYAMYLMKKFSKGMTAKAVPYVGGISNFIADPKFSQQCFVTSEPLIAKAKGLKVKTFLVAESGYNPYTTVVITRRTYLDKNPALVKSVVAAVREGWRTYLDKPTDVDGLMNKLNPSMDLATFKESGMAQRPLIETTETKTCGLGCMTEGRWAELADQLFELKLIETKPKVKELFVTF